MAIKSAVPAITERVQRHVRDGRTNIQVFTGVSGGLGL
jgi:hypothetical protein